MTLRNSDRSGTPAGVFGAELRHYRTQAGLAQTELAARTHVSHDVISKIETGDRPPAEDFPPRLDAVPELDTRGELTRIWENLRKGLRHRAYPGWFERWKDIEAEATALRWYESNLIPGLLQTEGYARAILAARPDSADEDLDGAVSARMSRQAILDDEAAPHLWIVLDEGVLHRRIGGNRVMHPTLCAEIIRMFDDPAANPHGAQLIFTTHDVTLLRTLTGGERVLDRDAVWLTEKKSGGFTELYPLKSFRPPPRKDDNLFRRYLLGAYGGTPRIGPGELAREIEEALA